jgi:ferredoxin
MWSSLPTGTTNSTSRPRRRRTCFALTHTSRLGCQIKITEELDGLTVTLPSATRNMMVDR